MQRLVPKRQPRAWKCNAASLRGNVASLIGDHASPTCGLTCSRGEISSQRGGVASWTRDGGSPTCDDAFQRGDAGSLSWVIAARSEAIPLLTRVTTYLTQQTG